MKLHFVHLLGGAAALLVAGAAPATRPPAGSSGIDLAAIDRGVRPGDDFDAFASGAWRRRTVISADRQDVGTVDDLVEQTQQQLREVIVAATARPRTSSERLIGELYGAFIDVARAEQLDDAPLRPLLAEVAAVSDQAGMARLMGRTQGGFGAGAFICDVWVDLKDPTRPALRLRQAGLGLEYPEAYGDQRNLEAYQAYVQRSLQMVGWPQADAMAAKVVAFETRIARVSWSTADNRDRVRRYNPMSREELKALAPGFAWDAYLDAVGAPGGDTIFVQQKSAMPAIAAVVAETPLDQLKAWEAFRIVDAASPYLSRRFRDSSFAFRGRVLAGLEEDRPRWRQGVELVNELLPDALGRAYVERDFDEAAKPMVEEMAANFRAAMAVRIDHAAWMSPETRLAAQAKLRNVRFLIGHPVRWRDYRDLSLDRRDLFGSILRAKAFNWRAEIAKLSGPANPQEWFLPPQTVDGFSDQSRLIIGVPAAILQPPFFGRTADAAANYGALGELMGHELTHQFDDQGRKYGSAGGLHDWWTPADAERFEARARQLAVQFDRIEILPGVHLNGRQTLSENIADLGGLLLALDAYHLSLRGRPAPVIDGLTGDQRVFLAWARVFRSKDRPENLRAQALGGTHTPFKYRVIQPMRNIDAWYAAFDVRPGQRSYLAPEERVRIW